MHAKISKMAGAGKVILSDVNPERLAIARHVDPSFIAVSGDPGAELERLTAGQGADVIITACPVAAAQTRAIELAAINGRVIFFGGLPKGASVVPLDTNIIHYKQLLVTGTTRQSLRHFQKTLDLISSGVIEVDDLITSTHSIADAEAAITQATATRGLKTRIAFEV
jgi:L-iditol 2-dehydrogenase